MNEQLKMNIETLKEGCTNLRRGVGLTENNTGTPSDYILLMEGIVAVLDSISKELTKGIDTTP